MIRKWQNELLSYRSKDGEPYAPTYLKTIHAQLSAIMNYAVKYYGLPNNPCHVSGSIGKSNAGEMSIWTREQFEYFITFEKHYSFHCAFNTLFYTGMREGELLALTPQDILVNEKSISINKNYAVVKGDEYFLTPKTDKSKRIITIHKQLCDELQAYISSMCINPDERIFYFTKSGLSKEFARVTDRAELPHIRIHDLRHSHASMLIQMKVPITEISKRLGHESPEITLQIYSHLYPGNERNVPNLIDALFEPESVENMDDSE